MKSIKYMNKLRIIPLVMVMGIVSFLLISGAAALQYSANNDFNPELNKALNWMKKNQDSEGRWIGLMSPSTSGASFAVIALMKSGESPDTMYINDGINWLINNQNEDGGWGEQKNVPSSMPFTGLAIAGLTAGGVPYDSAVIQKGVDYINRNGGFPETGIFASTLLADQKIMAPEQIPPNPINIEDINNKTRFDYIANPDVRMLFFTFALIEELQYANHTQEEEAAMEKIINWFKSTQFSDGSWEEISATYLVTIAMIEYGEPVDSPYIQRAITWIRENQQSNGGYANIKDLRVTDTALMLQGISELTNKNKPSKEIYNSVKWLYELQNVDGGWGWIEEKSSDIDDTAIVLYALTSIGENPSRVEIQKGVSYLLSTQEEDGSWTTYGGGFLDPSSVDVTGRTIIALIDAGISNDEPEIKNASRYLLSQQRADGTWDAFWCMGPVYGSAYPVQALLKAGISSEDPSIQKSVNWFINHQNSDGGWGNWYWGSELSGSTAEETALAVYTLLEAGIPRESLTIINGMEWLSKHQNKDGSWKAADIFLYTSKERYYDTAFPNALAISAIGKYKNSEAFDQIKVEGSKGWNFSSIYWSDGIKSVKNLIESERMDVSQSSWEASFGQDAHVTASSAIRYTNASGQQLKWLHYYPIVGFTETLFRIKDPDYLIIDNDHGEIFDSFGDSQVNISRKMMLESGKNWSITEYTIDPAPGLEDVTLYVAGHIGNVNGTSYRSQNNIIFGEHIGVGAKNAEAVHLSQQTSEMASFLDIENAIRNDSLNGESSGKVSNTGHGYFVYKFNIGTDKKIILYSGSGDTSDMVFSNIKDARKHRNIND